MSEPCIIACELSNGTVEGIILSEDADPAHLSVTLTRFYSSRYRVIRLLQLGNLRLIASTLDQCIKSNEPVTVKPGYNVQHFLDQAWDLGIKRAYVRQHIMGWVHHFESGRQEILSVTT